MATASVRAAAAAIKSDAALIFGRATFTGRSRRGGKSLSMQIRIAMRSPVLASSMALRVMMSDSPPSNASMASVVLWRAPFGFPARLTELPFAKVPSGFRPEFFRLHNPSVPSSQTWRG